MLIVRFQGLKTLLVPDEEGNAAVVTLGNDVEVGIVLLIEVLVEVLAIEEAIELAQRFFTEVPRLSRLVAEQEVAMQLRTVGKNFEHAQTPG